MRGMSEERMHEEAWGVKPEVIARGDWRVLVVWLMGRDYVVPGVKVARSRYGLWLGETPLGELVVGKALRTVAAELIRRSCWEEREKWEELAKAVEEGRADAEVWEEGKYYAWLKAKVLAGVKV